MTTRDKAARDALLARLERHGALPRRAFDPEERRILEELLREGAVQKRGGRYVRRRGPELLYGRLAVTRRGRAFLVQEGDDLEISSGGLGGGLHGDTVVARRRKGRVEVVEVVARAHERVVGTVVEEGGRLELCPAEPRLPRFLVQGDARPGDVVVLAVESFGTGGPPAGKVVEVLGREGAPGVDVLAIVHRHDLRQAFPAEVLRAAAQLPDRVRAEDLKGRLDLRQEEVFTIDGADAKDLDDAVSLRAKDGGYELGVHIADVGHYAREGSALEEEAYRRGTSVYLVDRVLPMFPPELSNGLASLHPGVDRLTLSVFLEFDAQGRRRSVRIVPSVIHSRGRLTYEGVYGFLAGVGGEGAQEAERFGPTLQAMERLQELLRGRRQRRGAIDFDLPEDKVLLGADGEPLAIVRRRRTVAERIIEEFMLAANEAVAQFAAQHELPVLYRVHERPPLDKLEAFRKLCALLGVRFSRQEDPPPKAFQAVLARAGEGPDGRLLQAVALRTMARARYSPENLGHYGLAAPYYCHFTSPIRRYPDLLVQRVLKEHLAGTLSEARKAELAARLEAYAAHTSEREREAEAAERESVEVKKVTFLQDKVGEEYEGLITGVLPFGFFVELSIGVEGLVPLAALQDDYYRLDQEAFTIRGEGRRRSFRLGQEVRVRVERVDVRSATVDLALVEEKPARAARPRRTFDRAPRPAYNKKTRRRGRRSSPGGAR